MENGIARKMTSITLIAVMVAGGMTVAAPGLVPAVHADHNDNLFVSAEDTGSHVVGPQVVEIAVIDDDLSGTATTTAAIPPDVTLNGNAVAMTASVDGNWYAYVADAGQAAAIYGDSDNPGISFGTTNSCSIPGSDASQSYCNTINDDLNVVISAKAPHTDSTLWPFIQTYEFSPNIEIQYSKAGSTQTATLEFADDTPGSISLDRLAYPAGASIHLTINDNRLNLDPTSADVWTWDLTNDIKYYGGMPLSPHTVSLAADGIPTVTPGTAGRADTACLPCSLEIHLDRDSGDATTATTTAAPVIEILDGIPDLDIPDNASGDETTWFIVRETGGPNTGIFSATNSDDQSILKVSDTAAGGMSAAITYGDTTMDISVRHNNATIDIQLPRNGAWTPGLAIPITVSDGDANLNSKTRDDISISDANSAIPTLVTGDPFTLGEVSEKVTIWIIHVAAPPNAEFNRLLDSLNDPSGADPDKFIYAHEQEGALRLGGIYKPSEDAPWTVPADQPHRIGIRSIVTVDESTQRAFITLADFDPLVAESLTALGVPNLESLNTPILVFDFYDIGIDQMRETFIDNRSDSETGINVVNYDVASLGKDIATFEIRVASAPLTERIPLGNQSGYISITDAHIGPVFGHSVDGGDVDLPLGYTQILMRFAEPVTVDTSIRPIIFDFFSFGSEDDKDREIANQIVRFELAETGVDTGLFAGTLQYVMIDSLDTGVVSAFGGIGSLPVHDDDGAGFVATKHLTGSDAPLITYLDLDASGLYTQVSAPADVSLREGVYASNLRIVDMLGNVVGDDDDDYDDATTTATAAVAIPAGQQVQVTADLSYAQDMDHDFVYLVQIQDGEGITVALAWLAGSLSGTGDDSPSLWGGSVSLAWLAGPLSGSQPFSPLASWMPTITGTYTVTAFVWESLENPVALSPPITIDVSVY